jgi:hypothetical protein
MQRPQQAQPEGSRPARPRKDLLKGLRIARAMTVTSGGPVALALASALAPVAALGRWPSRLERPLARRAAWTATGMALALPAVYLSLVRPWLMTWGSTASERARIYPGDDPTGPEPALRITRAVTVDAPPEKVWPWVAQIGQQRGGFYSYDWLENLAGCQIHSAERIHPEWQDVHPGDPIGMAPDFGTEVEAVEPGHALVVKNWGAYVVEPAGEGRSRLVARAHVEPGLPSLAYALAIEVPHAVMERRMLLGIKQRAERAEREAPSSGSGYSRAA